MVREYSKALISSYMKIYDAKKIEIADVPVTKNAKHEQELMKSDYIRLEWSQEEYMPLPVGAYIEHEDVKYSLYEQYVPDNNGGVYQYKPEFQHPMMLLAHTPCLLATRDSVGKEIKQTDWTYTGILSTILGRLQGIIYDQLGIKLIFKTKFKPTTDVEESATCTFSGVDIISAFSEVCNQFGGIEYHIDWEGKTVWFGDIFLGDEVILEEGGNVGTASKSTNSKDFANYFIVRGGTRNITNKTSSGNNVQSDSRLSIDDIDKRASEEQPKVQKILTFDYIYPQLDLYVYNVRKRVRRLKDEDKQYVVKSYNADGTVAEYKTYAVYYMRLAYKEGEAWKDYTINNPSDDIVAGKKLTASFEPNEKGTHSQLAGREYELIYHKADKTIIANPTIGDSGVKILAGDYEIVFEQDGDLIIPNVDTLQPWGNSTPDGTCDKVVLYNIVMSDEYITNAKVRLAEEAEKEIERQYTDKTNYTVNSNPIEFAEQNPGLSIGRAVRYRTLSGEVMSTRINRLVTQLDYPIEQEITLGNAVIKGNTQQLKEDVKSISVAIDVNESSATRINSMLNSMMRELMEYDAHLLHRDRDDETAYKLTVGELLVKGIAKILSNVSVGGKVSTNGIENDGVNITKGLTELYDAISSHGFKNSMTAGSGWQIDKEGNAQVESIEVRSYMRVLELVMNRLSAEESEFIFTESGTVEKATFNEDDGTYTLVMRKKTDKDITAFQVDDVLKGVVNDLAEPGAVGVKYYTSWVQVKEVNQTDNSIKVAVYADKDTPDKKNFDPCDLMVLHRWGNTTKKERQSCWYISSIEKRIVMLDGVTKPIIDESNYASFYGLPFDMENFKGYTLNKNQPYLYVRGAFLQDVCFIDYLGKVVKQERYRGVWSQEVANNSDDPYIVTKTTFDTVYHKNAKWQCNSTKGTKEEPSVGTTDWTKLSEGGKGSDGKSAAKAYVTSNDIAIPTDANGVVTENFQIGNTFSLMVDGKNCTDLKVTMDETPSTNAFKAQLNQLWLTISSSKGAELGLLAYTLHFTVKGVLDNVTYSDVVTILVRPNRAGRNLTKVSNFYKWGASGMEAPSGEYTQDAIPKHVEGLDYLWNYEVCYNDAGETISTSEKTCIGNFARGIESITEYYQIGTAEKPDKPISVDTIDASGWQTIMPFLTAEKRYLWNLEMVRFTDGTYSISEVHLAGAQGESITIEQKLVYYAISASGTSTPPDSWFSDAVKEPTIEKPYLWTCVSIRYSDTTVVKYYTVARRGENGAPGRNLTKVVNYYKWGARGTEAPSGDYAENKIPEHTDGLDYLWNYEVCYSANDLLSQSGKTCIGYFPKNGEPGKDGKGIKSITEYYQVGTERKPAAISISTDGTKVTIPSGWKTTMGTTTADNRFVWNQEVIEYSNSTYSVTAVHLAGAQGDKGDPGEDGVDGNGMEYIYMRTEGSKAPNAPSTNGSTPTGWTKEPSGVNAEYPYEWVSMRIQDKGVWGSYSKPILWKEYYALNANLLEQTDFDGLLTKWESRSVYEGTSYEDDSINHISNDGKDGVNCYYDISSRMKYESLYKDVLMQRLVNNSVTKLKPSTWYTLSFYAKCGVNVKPVNLTSNEYGFGVRTVYLERGKRYKFSISGRIDSQAKNDGKTLRCYVYNGDWSWNKTLIIDTTIDAVKSIEFSDVPSNGTYQFRAYMFENGGSRAGKVTLNWANVEEVDGELFSTYIYPSLVDNTKVFVDGEQKAVSSDCNVTYKASSSDWVRHTVTFKTRSTLGSKQNLLFRMLPIVMFDNTHYLKICMPKLEVGKVASAWQLNEADRMGKNGKPLVGPTEWNASAWYMSGKGDNEAYQSIVINPKYPKQMYLCGYSHSGKEPSSTTSTSSVDTCTEDQPWVQVAYQDFVATKVLFADKSLIKDLNAETIEMRDSNGNTLFYLHGGNLECNVGTFKNITAIGGTFNGIEVTGNSTFKGTLQGVTGSFRELNCVDGSGNVAGGIKFDNSRMYFDGDLYSQGYNYDKKRGNRFYASDVWCRGNFGHRGKAMAVVYGDYMMAYPNGLEDSDGDRSAVRVSLTKKTTGNGKTFYDIPLYSPDSNGENNDASGMPIDVVIFNITDTSKEWLYRFTRLSSGKEWRVFNANNNFSSLYIADTGTWRKLPGGANASYMYVPPKFLTPAMSSDIIGAGVFVSYISDIDW